MAFGAIEAPHLRETMLRLLAAGCGIRGICLGWRSSTATQPARNRAVCRLKIWRDRHPDGKRRSRWLRWAAWSKRACAKKVRGISSDATRGMIASISSSALAWRWRRWFARRLVGESMALAANAVQVRGRLTRMFSHPVARVLIFHRLRTARQRQQTSLRRWMILEITVLPILFDFLRESGRPKSMRHGVTGSCPIISGRRHLQRRHTVRSSANGTPGIDSQT